MEILKAENISKSFGDKQVLNNVGITLNKGEIVSLLGVSGAGKTTLFNILSGIYKADTGKVYLNGEDVSSLIRTPDISMAASDVSKIPAVRAFLLGLQRDIAENNNVIMDGRDIATVVLPNAQVKIFLTASPECRAERRYKELLEKGESVKYEDVLADVNARDYQDSHREIAPLKPAEDSYIADTSGKSLPQSIEMIVSVIKEKTNGEV